MLRELLIEIGIDIDLDPVVKLNEELDDMMKKFKKLDASKIEDLGKDFEKIQKTVKELNKDFTKMEKNIKDVRKQTDKLGDGFKDMRKDVKRVGDSVDDLEDSIRDAREDADKLGDSFRDTERHAERLGDAVNDAERNMRDLRTEASRTGDAFEEMRREASRIESALNGLSMNNIRGDIQRLESALNGVRQEAERAGDATRQIGDGANNARGDVNRLSQEFGRLKQEAKEVGSTLESAIGGVMGGIAIQDMFEKALSNARLETQVEMSANPSLSDGAVKSMQKQVKRMAALTDDPEGSLLAAQRQYNLNPGNKNNNLNLNRIAAMQMAYPSLDSLELVQESNEIAKSLKISQGEALSLTNYLLKVGFPAEQMDIISEYGTQLSMLGYNAEQIGGIMQAATDTKSWNIDNLLDGLKEGRIKTTEFAAGLSKSEKEIVQMSGISQSKFEDLVTRIGKGGPEAATGFKALIDEVNKMPEGLEKIQMSTLIFGTLGEDNMIPLLETMENYEDKIVPMSNMTKELADTVNTMNDDPLAKLSLAMMQLNEAMRPVYDQLTDLVSKFAQFMEDHPNMAKGFAWTAAAVAGLAALSAGLLAVKILMSPLVTIASNLGRALKGAVKGIGKLFRVPSPAPTPTTTTIGGKKYKLDRTAQNGRFGRRTAPNPRGGNYQNWRRQQQIENSLPGSQRRTILGDLGRQFVPQPQPVQQTQRQQQQQVRRFRGRLEQSRNGTLPNPWNNPANASATRSLQQADPNKYKNTAGKADGKLVFAANKLTQAANALIRAASMLSAGGVGGKGGKGKKGGKTPKSTAPMPRNTTPKPSPAPKPSPTPTPAPTPKPPKGSGGFAKLGALGKLGGVAGLALGGLAIGSQIKSGDGRGASETGGSMAGGLAGAAAGAAIGSIIPGLGTAIGGLVGGVAGSIGGSKLGGKLYDGVKSFDWNGLKSKASEAKESMSTTWSSMKSGAVTAFQSMGSGVSTAFQATKGAVGTAASAIGKGAVNSFNTAKTGAVNAANLLKTGAVNAFNLTKTGASTVFGGMKTVISTLSNGAKDSAVKAFSTLKSNLSSSWSGLKSMASTVWEGVGSAISGAISGAVSKVKSLMSGLGTTISSAASTAKTKLGKLAEGAKTTATNLWNKITNKDGSHASGLGRVPFNGYMAELHKDEAVLTASQANLLRKYGMLQGDGAAPSLSLNQAADYQPLASSPSKVAASTNNSNQSVQASISITVNGSDNPQSVAVSIKDELENWFAGFNTVFPATMEG